jgi:hypothetical protein
MRKQLLLCGSVAAVLLLAVGCETDPARKAKMQGQSGKMNRYNDYSYFAVCRTITAGGHTNVWKAAPWREKERAMQDALEHNRANPGHQAEAEHN